MVTTLDLGAYLSVGRVARTLSVSDTLVREWLQAGRLPYLPTPLGALVAPEDVERLRQEREARRRPSSQTA